MNLSFCKNKRKIDFFMCGCSIICFCLIFFLSSQSNLPSAFKPFFGLDKLEHAFVFGALAFSLSYWFSKKSWNKHTFKCAIIVFAVAACFGISDEVHQYFVKGRDSSVYDWLADCTGAALASGLRTLIVKTGKKKENSF